MIRDGKIIKKIDFYSYLTSGKKINDIPLINDDVIFIPTRGKTVTMKGKINREAIYELKENENLKVIEIAGGLISSTFTKRVQIDRIIPFEENQLDMTKLLLTLTLQIYYQMTQMLNCSMVTLSFRINLQELYWSCDD